MECRSTEDNKDNPMINIKQMFSHSYLLTLELYPMQENQPQHFGFFEKTMLVYTMCRRTKEMHLNAASCQLKLSIFDS